MISSRLRGRDSLLFVYGTLRPFVAIPMARWLAGAARYVGSAKTRGRLYDLGPYPGLAVARGAREWVVGDVYRIGNPRVLRALDRYEAGVRSSDPTFERVSCVVTLEDGTRKSAWAYFYRRSVVHAARVVSGDYRAHLER